MSQKQTVTPRVADAHKEYDATVEMRPLHGTTGQASHPGVGPYQTATYTTSDSSLSSSTSSTTPATALNSRHVNDDSPSPTLGHKPRWLRNSTDKSRKHIEAVFQNPKITRLVSWLRGPPSPRTYKVKPILPKVQNLPREYLSRWLPGKSVEVASIVVLAVWLVLFSFLLSTSVRQSSDAFEGQSAQRLACNARLWPNTTFCGLDGRNCQPFDGDAFAFYCPSNCASLQVLEPHTIGNQEIVYRNMVIGGPTPANESLSVYRGDSFICPAAIHSGVVSNERGGCGVLVRRGEHRQFTASSRNGIDSIGFLPGFPLSFSFTAAKAECHDTQWKVFGVSCLAATLISLLTASSSLFFASTLVIAFFQTALVSDPPFFPDFSSILSMAFERFLPTIFVALVLYRFCLKHTLQGLEARFERTVLWLGGCWIGALNDYTFDKIPISRLTPHDLRQQPGAITALIVILVLIIAAAVGQAWAFRVEGRLLRYLGFYLALGLVIGCLMAIPGLQLRLHHYIIALLLLPGTSLQTRPSLLYQGILVGLFINGIARWGYASVLQTAEALREDGQLGSALPQVLRPTFVSDNVTFTLSELSNGFDGLSVLVNDVERYQQSHLALPSTLEWTRTDPNDPVFFRFAFTGTRPLGGIWYGDYTKPGTWYSNGTWEAIQPGPSR